MNFEDGPRLNYAYRLEGYDRNWMNAGQNLSATYSSVPAGKYCFRVRVQTPDGQWTESKESVGTTPQKFLITYRLNRAKDLLESSQYNVSEVCYRVGFAALGSFFRSFKNKFGVSPSEI